MNWIMMKDREPTYEPCDEYWEYRYAIVLDIQYDCIGLALSDKLYKVAEGKKEFVGFRQDDTELRIPFDMVHCWMELTQPKSAQEEEVYDEVVVPMHKENT